LESRKHRDENVGSNVLLIVSEMDSSTT